MQNLIFYKNKSFITLIILLVVSVGLMFLNVKITNFNVRSIFTFITYPFQAGISAVGGFFANTAVGITKINELQKELDEANKRLLMLQENQLLYSQMSNENQELRNTLGIKSRLNYTTSYARIVARDPNLTGDHLVIDKGLMDGIRNNMPVVSFDTNGSLSLVGRTFEVGFAGSKVKTITAFDSSVGVTLKQSGYVGILKGRGSWNQNCLVDFIPVEADTFIGEEIVTSGESDIFPKGLLVGTVVGIGRNQMEEFFKKLWIKPSYKYMRIKEVFIIEWLPEKETVNTSEFSDERKYY